MGAGANLLDPGSKVTVVLDKQILTVPGPLTDGSWTAHFRKNGATWAEADDDPKILRKRHNLQGPIDDAFMDSFLMVSPTGTPLNERVGNWAKTEEERAIHEWRTQFRGDAPVKEDTALTEADIASKSLVLWGDPQSNKVLARIMDKLPLHWPAAANALIMIYPNPLNPAKYVVLNSGFTFREYAYSSNALQIAQLPDYAVIDLATPPDERRPGKIVTAGFFGENWQLLERDGQ
jgi:hypothetical protein